MNNAQIRTSIETLFAAAWPHIAPIAYENVPFDPPEEGEWVRISIQPLAHDQAGLGDCKELTGMVSVELFSPMRTGTSKLEQMRDSTLAILNKTYDEVSFKNATISLVGEQEGWYRSNIFTSYIARTDITI